MVYSVCQTTHPATTVEHSIQCQFYNLNENNLVVAGANQLTVYRIESKLLEHCQTFELYGNVASMQRIALGNKGSRKRDSLVLSFHDAKLSIVEYNPETHDLRTLSMHYFEDDNLKDGRVMNQLKPPIVRVDPNDSCIAMLVYGRHIVVIPLDKDEEDLEHELYNTSSSPRSQGDASSDNDEPILSSSTSIRNTSSTSLLDRSQIIGQVVALKPTPTSFKSPFLPSYKLDLSEETCGEKIDNIVDIQFLYNYYDPTLVILQEPTRTWSGRVAMRQDTFSIIALSMNIHQRLQPIIWTVNSLPYDSLRIMPVPKPIGGLLVVACNELIYLNQSVPAFGMSFNGFSKDGSAFPLNEAKSETGDKVDYINISLDLSQSVFMTHNKILFILKDGDVFLVTLFNDDMRSIKNFNFERVGSTVQPNCLTLCENNLLFIGSHVGDSILAELEGDLGSAGENLDAYADDESDSMISQEEREPIMLYEHDQILSTSASGRICYGEATNLSNGLRNDHRDPSIELIMSAGFHKNGSICILQRTIKPMIEDTYELKVCGDLWTVTASKWANSENSRLLLNRDHETMAFSTIGELKELKSEECAFKTNEPSIFAANIGACNLTVQVMSQCVQLISNDKTIDIVTIEDGKICDVSMADPHLVVLTQTGSLFHLQLNRRAPTHHDGDGYGYGDGHGDSHGHDDDETAEQYGFSCQEVGRLTDGQVISLSLYKDVSGLFTCKSASPSNVNNNFPAAGNSHMETLKDDDDDIDYGDDEDDRNEDEPTYWLFVVDDRGVLEIFGLPNFNLVYLVDNFPSAPSVLTDNVKLFITDLDTTIAKTKEILMCSLGRNNKRPLLFVRNALELVIYETFKYTDVDISNHLKIRFKKTSTVLLDTVVPFEYELEGNSNNNLTEPMEIDEKPHQHQASSNHTSSKSKSSHSNGRSSSSRRRHHNGEGRSSSRQLPNLRERWLQKKHWLRQFQGIGGYNGIFLAGFKPHWFIMTDRCELRTHPMNIEGAIYAFSQYDKENFIYFNEHRELRIARLPREMSLDSHWPMKKLNMKETVHFVNYHVERKVYSVVTSRPVPCLKIMRVGNEPDSLKIEDLERECGYIPPMIEKFRLRLYDSETWVEIPDCEIEFDEWEQVTCVKNVSLASEGTQSGLKGYIALSTNYCYGEDVPNRGRIWILDLIEVVPEPERPLTKNKIKKVYCQEQKGPVTTLSHTCGLLMSAVGQKIYLWQLKEEQLDGVAFIDTQIYIHCASSIKNLILVSDVCKSVSLLRYQQETRTLSMVCRDPRQLEVFACDFIIDNELLTFLVADAEQNLMIYAHEPEDEESQGGTRLIRRADYHLGANVISFSRLRGKIPAVFAGDPNEVHYCRRRQLTMFCTVDGAIGLLFPIHQSIYQQFLALQNEMTLVLSHAAGLNPKAWRCVKQSRPGLMNPCHGIIDGDIVRRFMMLSVKERNELTKKIGVSTEKIMADIQIIRESTMYF